MHRMFVSAKRRSVCTSSNVDSTSSDADRVEFHRRNQNRRPTEFLDLTETDVTETTFTVRSEEIVEQSNRLSPPRSPQLLMEDMIHRLREVSGDNFEVQSAIAPVSSVNITSISAMTSHLRNSNHTPIQSLSQRFVGSTAKREHHPSDSIALRRPCRTTTTRTAHNPELAVESLHRNRMKSLAEVVPDHSSHIPFSELIDRLHRVNMEITTEPKLHVTLQRKAKISLNKSDDELARILHQVNCRCVVAEEIAESDCDARKTPASIVAESLDRESHHPILEYLSSNHSTCSWIEEECGTATSADYISLAAHVKHSPAFGDLCSHLADDDDDESGCTLHPSALSCASSVTWFEGSDIDEILIEDDDVSASIDFGSIDENS